MLASASGRFCGPGALPPRPGEAPDGRLLKEIKGFGPVPARSRRGRKLDDSGNTTAHLSTHVPACVCPCRRTYEGLMTSSGTGEAPPLCTCRWPSTSPQGGPVIARSLVFGPWVPKVSLGALVDRPGSSHIFLAADEHRAVCDEIHGSGVGVYFT